MANGDKIGVCPRCGGDIIETEKAYGCSNWKGDDGCKFTIWKNVLGRDMSVDEVKQILEKGKTDEYLDGFVSKKTGKTFSAKVVLNKDGPYSTSFEFPPKA
jgi:DNA topoisomerase-3